MTAAADERSGAPRAVLLLPVAVLAHVVEEWFGGFPAWTATVFGSELSPERFLVINAVGLLLVTAGAVAAVRSREAAWLGVTLAALFTLNALLHLGLSAAYGSYSPGTVTGVVLYLPLGAVVLRRCYATMSGGTFAGSVLLGIGVHAVVTFTALG